jgi:aspartate racemase
MFSRIGKLLGGELPLSLLLQAPTIAELSELLSQDGWTPSWSCLVPINSEGVHPPLFLVHAGGGNILSYHRLSRHLGADQPVWGLQPQGLKAAVETESRVEDIAETYLKAIRLQQPRGPYFLGGHSFGAVVALEMAQRLRGAGESVPLLAVLDHAGPSAQVRWNDWIRWHLICLSQLDAGDQLRYVRDRVRFRIVSNGKLPEFLRRVAAGSLARKGGQKKATIRLKQLQSSLDAMENYKIQIYPGRITLFRARQAAPRIHADDWGGWRETALGGVDVQEIPGHHMNMLEEPHVRVLAERMRLCLQNARATVVGPEERSEVDAPAILN